MTGSFTEARSCTYFFYKELAAPAIAALSEGISYTYFNLKDYEKPLHNNDLKDDVKLVALYKLLSPPHLLEENLQADQENENSSPVCYAHLREFREGFED